MLIDSPAIHESWPDTSDHQPCPPSVISFGHPGDEDAPEGQASSDLSKSERWLRQQIAWPDSFWEERLIQAICVVAEEMNADPGPVELIIAPCEWHNHLEISVFRPVREGSPAKLQTVPFGQTELLLLSQRKPLGTHVVKRRSGRQAVHLVFDLSDIATSVEPGMWDIAVHVAHRVRQHLRAIERL